MLLHTSISPVTVHYGLGQGHRQLHQAQAGVPDDVEDDAVTYSCDIGIFLNVSRQRLLPSRILSLLRQVW